MTTFVVTDPMVGELPNESCYIAGKWVAPDNTLKAESIFVIDPTLEEPIASFIPASRTDVAQAVSAARAAFPVWSARTVEERIALIEQVHALVIESTEKFAQIISREMGAPIRSARTAQVPLAAEHLRVAIEAGRRCEFEGERDGVTIRREAIGVVGLITPWNWPLYQITAKVGPALVAGCTVVLKPSELSPLSAMLFTQIVHAVGIPEGVFNIVLGTGPEVGDAIARHPGVDMVSITGSNRAGALVAQAAAESFKRVTQELGGKSPNVVLPDASFEVAIPKGVLSAFRNAGQSCSAPTRMIVPRAHLAEIEALTRKTAEGLKIGLPSDEATDIGPIANAPQFGRVHSMIAAGVEEGARLVCGGANRPSAFTKGYFVRPTVFSDVKPDMRIAQEEIFGPVLCLQPYDTVDEAIALANNTTYGLSAHVQSQDETTARAVAARIRAGQVHINYPAWNPWAPFGGYGRSGNGREYGSFGLEEYLEVKAVLSLS